MEKVINTTQNIYLKDRKNLCIDAVINVESFDEEYMYLSTKLGNIGIEGRGLKIESLTKDDCKIFITGEITSISYYEEKQKRKTGKIFK